MAMRLESPNPSAVHQFFSDRHDSTGWASERLLVNARLLPSSWHHHKLARYRRLKTSNAGIQTDRPTSLPHGRLTCLGRGLPRVPS